MKQRLGIYFGEFFGTFLLVFFGISAVAVSVLFDAISGIVQISIVWGIGATVSALIAVTAPLTQTGINPARDFGPRLMAYFAGWGKIAIPGPQNGFFWVYILAPLIGGSGAAGFFRFILAPLMAAKNRTLEGSCDFCNDESQHQAAEVKANTRRSLRSL